MTPIGNILVATDFSAASTRALEVAAEIACRYGAKLTVLHTIENHSNAPACGVPPEIRRSAAFRLSETVRPVAQHVPAVEGMLREGLAWHEITEGAKEAAADLVVVGSHGLGHGDRFMIGSVAEKVVRVCPVPVLTVHAWRFPDRTQAGRELAEMLLRSDEQVSAVIALSRGGAVVGAEVAEAFGTSLNILLTRALERDGYTLGAVCEDGTVHFNGRGERLVAERDREDAGRAQAELVAEARGMGGHRWLEDGKAGTMVLVSEAILTPDSVIVAAKALRKARPHRLVAAAPVGTLQARDALTKVVDGVTIVQIVEHQVPLGRVFRDLSVPKDRAVVERLTVAAEWAHAVEKSQRDETTG